MISQYLYAKRRDARIITSSGTVLYILLYRTGLNVKVSVDGADVTTTLPLGANQFNLRRGDSYLFVGAPPPDFDLPAGVNRKTLEGGFDQLFIDGRKVGLYDAVVRCSY